MANSRVDIIDETLIYHHNVKKEGGGLECLCGHQMALGKSIYQHQAEVIDQAIRTLKKAQHEHLFEVSIGRLSDAPCNSAAGRSISHVDDEACG